MGLVMRATVIYFFLWLLARGMGERELVLSTLTFWMVVMSYWRGFTATRSVFEGLPVVIVQNGDPIEEMLRLERVTR